MGGLSSAVRSVEFERHASDDIVATCASMQGFRGEMEDAHSVHLRLPSHPNTSFIGVYDGHSGPMASAFLANQLWREIDGLDKITESGLTDIMKKIDEHWSKDRNREQGSTIVFALIDRPKKDDKKQVYKCLLGWVGDSRVIASKKGDMKELTDDHKPQRIDESKRIVKAGGHVSVDNRVDGELAMSRAFGDWNLKDDHCMDGNTRRELAYEERKVVCIPEFSTIELEQGDSLLISCDGLTEHLENDQLFNRWQASVEKHAKDPDVVLDDLLQAALDSGSKDNMTTCLVELRDGAEYQKRYAKRLRTFRPGPLFGSLGNSQFVKAYLKNAKHLGIPDSVELREVAYKRDLNLIEDKEKEKDRVTKIEEGIEELKTKDFEDIQKKSEQPERPDNQVGEIMNFVNLLKGIQQKAQQQREDAQDGPASATDADDAEQKISMEMEAPTSAEASAFPSETEFLLKPKHDKYMAFLSASGNDEELKIEEDDAADEPMLFRKEKDEEPAPENAAAKSDDPPVADTDVDMPSQQAEEAAAAPA